MFDVVKLGHREDAYIHTEIQKIAISKMFMKWMQQNNLND